MKRIIKLRVNGDDEEVPVEPWWSLAFVLRELLGLTGTKLGCKRGDCGSCTVLIDGKAVKSCLILVGQAKGKDIVTIEGLADKARLHPLQQAFIDHFAVQCGYCSPGMILTAKALIDENPNPTEEEVRFALNGNICRCTGYHKIVEAILAVRRKEA